MYSVHAPLIHKYSNRYAEQIDYIISLFPKINAVAEKLREEEKCQESNDDSSSSSDVNNTFCSKNLLTNKNLKIPSITTNATPDSTVGKNKNKNNAIDTNHMDTSSSEVIDTFKMTKSSLYFLFCNNLHWQQYFNTIKAINKHHENCMRRIGLKLQDALRKRWCRYCWFPVSCCICEKLLTKWQSKKARFLKEFSSKSIDDLFKGNNNIKDEIVDCEGIIIDDRNLDNRDFPIVNFIDFVFLLHHNELMRHTNSAHIAAIVLNSPVLVCGVIGHDKEIDRFCLNKNLDNHRDFIIKSQNDGGIKKIEVELANKLKMKNYNNDNDIDVSKIECNINSVADYEIDSKSPPVSCYLPSKCTNSVIKPAPEITNCFFKLLPPYNFVSSCDFKKNEFDDNKIDKKNNSDDIKCINAILYPAVNNSILLDDLIASSYIKKETGTKKKDDIRLNKYENDNPVPLTPTSSNNNNETSYNDRKEHKQIFNGDNIFKWSSLSSPNRIHKENQHINQNFILIRLFLIDGTWAQARYINRRIPDDIIRVRLDLNVTYDEDDNGDNFDKLADENFKNIDNTKESNKKEVNGTCDKCDKFSFNYGYNDNNDNCLVGSLYDKDLNKDKDDSEDEVIIPEIGTMFSALRSRTRATGVSTLEATALSLAAVVELNNRKMSKNNNLFKNYDRNRSNTRRNKLSSSSPVLSVDNNQLSLNLMEAFGKFVDFAALQLSKCNYRCLCLTPNEAKIIKEERNNYKREIQKFIENKKVYEVFDKIKNTPKK